MSRRVAHVPTDLVPRITSAGLSAPARLVLLVLLVDPAMPMTGVTASGTDHLAAATGQPVSSVRRALAELEECGFIQRDLATGETFVVEVIAGIDAARHDVLEHPLVSWWLDDAGIGLDRTLPSAIASARLREAAAAALRRVVAS